MYVFIHICHICRRILYIHVYIYMYICIYIYVHMFIYIYPIGSMYAIYGNIDHQYTPNVSIYTIHGSYGYVNIYYICLQIYIYIYMFKYIYIYTYIYMFLDIHIYICF